jgi:hypothetical protein
MVGKEQDLSMSDCLSSCLLLCFLSCFVAVVVEINRRNQANDPSLILIESK